MTGKRYIKPLKDFSAYRALRMLLRCKAVQPAFRYFLKSYGGNYLLLRFRQRWGITKIPILNTAHKLDDRIPFDGKKLCAYSDFARFILRNVALLFEKLEKEAAEAAVSRLLRLLGGCYKKSAAVYQFCLSSTRYPPERGRRIFFRPNLVASSYLCMPGLHTVIAAALYVFMRHELHFLPLPEQTALLSEIHRGAMAAVESALFIKQQNIHGVAAALFLLSAAGISDFTDFDAEAFINSLFESDSGIENSDIFEIRSAILNLYRSFLEESKNAAEWQRPIYRWCKDFAEKTCQQDAFHRLELQLDLI